MLKLKLNLMNVSKVILNEVREIIYAGLNPSCVMRIILFHVYYDRHGYCDLSNY